ncbi:MAG TPA: hypothetical protein VLU25_01070, partial [Acidobacteriota bacterium]|nr:hypothetical protein [Acidobacteriota bacterium]
MKRIICALILLWLSCGPLWAQSDAYVSNHNLRGVVPFGSYQFESVDSVNLGTGSLEVNIPLFERAGRGLDHRGALTYSSKIWTSEFYDPPGPVTQGISMQLTTTARTFKVLGSKGELQWRDSTQVCSASPFIQVLIRSNFTYTTAGGATIRFPNRVVRQLDAGVCNLTSGSYTPGTSESGVMKLETPSAAGLDYVLTFKDGSKAILS